MKKKILFLFVFIPFLYGCPGGDEIYGIWLKNNTNRDLVIYIGRDGIGHTMWPDTLLPIDNLTIDVSGNHSFKYIFHKDFSQNNKVCIFFLDQDTITKYGWEKVRDDYMILKRSDLSKSELQKMNWEIVYEE